jgi:hypothetical protein
MPDEGGVPEKVHAPKPWSSQLAVPTNTRSGTERKLTFRHNAGHMSNDLPRKKTEATVG